MPEWVWSDCLEATVAIRWEREQVRVVRVETELGSGLERHSEVKQKD